MRKECEAPTCNAAACDRYTRGRKCLRRSERVRAVLRVTESTGPADRAGLLASVKLLAAWIGGASES